MSEAILAKPLESSGNILNVKESVQYTAPSYSYRVSSVQNKNWGITNWALKPPLSCFMVEIELLDLDISVSPSSFVSGQSIPITVLIQIAETNASYSHYQTIFENTKEVSSNKTTHFYSKNSSYRTTVLGEYPINQNNPVYIFAATKSDIGWSGTFGWNAFTAKFNYI